MNSSPIPLYALPRAQIVICLCLGVLNLAGGVIAVLTDAPMFAVVWMYSFVIAHVVVSRLPSKWFGQQSATAIPQATLPPVQFAICVAGYVLSVLGGLIAILVTTFAVSVLVVISIAFISVIVMLIFAKLIELRAVWSIADER